MKHGVTFDIIHSVHYSYSQSYSSRNARNKGKDKVRLGASHEGPEGE